MTKKQYRLNKWGTRLLKNNRPLFDWVNEADDIVDLLNELHEEKDYSEKKKCEYWNKFNLTHLDNINLRKENEQLKKEYLKLKHRHSLLHDECLDLECDKDRYYKDVLSLEKENEQLKKELKDWRFNCSSSINENSILWNEIAILREQGAKPSSAFEKYCSKFKGDVK